MSVILLVLLIVLLLGALPTWPHSRSWGYYPSGGLGLVVVIVLVLPNTPKMRAAPRNKERVCFG
jgi:hypothetical protein